MLIRGAACDVVISLVRKVATSARNLSIQGLAVNSVYRFTSSISFEVLRATDVSFIAD